MTGRLLFPLFSCPYILCSCDAPGQSLVDNLLYSIYLVVKHETQPKIGLICQACMSLEVQTAEHTNKTIELVRTTIQSKEPSCGCVCVSVFLVFS